MQNVRKIPSVKNIYNNNCHKFFTNRGFTYVCAMMEKFIQSGAITRVTDIGRNLSDKFLLS